ncbi:hypothetical protein NEMBOFW57_004198 [Staphylotrichum longicolle]|uniref:O-methyltransferase n=1 Tax=Staphylotrichum longicolle TaxID=669026 RepID=A0AAD4F6P1_9PEZI|nr:hypothetical protein NEMBOFW57_004198 [Staphylotrichum longicolle]
MSTSARDSKDVAKYNPVWATVDTRRRGPTASLENALAASREAGLPNISLSAAQGKFLAALPRRRVTHALEVGTLGGYSAIWLASENPALRLTTVEYEPLHVEAAGLADRIEVIHGAGVDVLPRLRDEVRAGARPPFVGQGYGQAQRGYLRRQRGPQGGLADANSTDPSVTASRLLVEEVGKLSGVDSVLLQTVGEKGWDGWLWAVVS